jgi:hypothetical protein
MKKNKYEVGVSATKFLRTYGVLHELMTTIEQEQGRQLDRILRAKAIAADLGKLSRKLGFSDETVIKRGFPGIADILADAKVVNAKEALKRAFKGHV